jgi:phage virion morphogenesis protein
MAGATLTLESAEVQRALEILRRHLVDTSPLMAELGEIVLSQAQDSFENQATPDGDPWEPSQRALATGGQTLVDSGQLLASLGVAVLPEAVEVGSNKLYAAIHQFGGKAGRGRAVEIPARPYLPDESTVDMVQISRAIDAFFAEVFG